MRFKQIIFKGKQTRAFPSAPPLQYLNPTVMRKKSQEIPFLLQIQADQQQIASIREQRQLVFKIQSTIAKKDQQISSLKTLLEKYQVYQQKYSSLKVELAEKGQLLSRKEGESRLLRAQLQELIREGEEVTTRGKQWETQKQQLVRERHALQRSSKDTERTFKDYQGQCRKREQQLLQELERAYQNNKEQISRIDELQIEVERCNTFRSRIVQLEKELQERCLQSKEETPAHRPNFTESDDLTSELMRLQEELLRKEEELSRQQLLNYELTIEYDRSVSSLCSLQSEVSAYRKENIELKQMVGLIRQQLQGRQVELRYSKARSSNLTKKEDSASCQEDICQLQTSFHEIQTQS